MPAFEYHPPTDPWLSVVYEDDDIIVIDKPSGLLSVPGREPEHHDSAYLRVVSQHPLAQIVHRLDMATSGIVLFAKHKQAERHLKAQFRDRIPQKRYIARVWGHLKQDAGEIDLPLICDWPNRPKQKVCFEQGKPSQTGFEVLARETREDGMTTSVVDLKPITGRSHQLRVHMMSLGHEIIGDGFYARPMAQAMTQRLELHALELTLKHPRTNQWCHFFAPCDFYPEVSAKLHTELPQD
ncbi:bifunctional tRNA pseudouridine(32) synthase/23S rRNA pseudouridine(746) synthase RluA [Vibrio stylophorae]|uniref:bifunctional tRNA pseudouridine(32) synthase/23S rRNA pseudouridine(746) synthase RluA n=1 Tax=Vibrio stylophorae TaxID=659351 RepID=UPI001F02EFBB|nr:bifunctional tRNA pseudouridine(32) synthase/23S rRNA pseudouridine(746) synthase RluA [Vibrio stylophorae]